MRLTALILLASTALTAQATRPADTTILHDARLLDVEAGRVIEPGEVLVRGGLIVEVGQRVTSSAGVPVRDLGNVTLMPGLIDAHVHLFLHVGDEANQYVVESVPKRTLLAGGGAK